MLEVELWHYRAYDYGWRRVFLNNHERTSPIDPDGRWFEPRGVKQAEWMFAAEPKPRVQSWSDRVAAAYQWKQDRGETMPVGIPENDPEVVALVAEYELDLAARQDHASAAARARLMQQASADLNAFVSRGRAAMSDDPARRRAAMRDLQRDLGLSATEAADG